jgi:hypothetical protein
MAHPATSALQQALTLLAEVAAAPALHLDDDELCALAVAAEEAGRLVDATRLAAAAEIDHRSRFELGSDGLAYRLGHRRGIHLVEQLTRVSQAEAVRRVRVGAALRPRLGLGGELLAPEFPRMAEAVASGSVGTDAAAAVTRCLGQAARNGADPEHVAAAERELVAEALREPADNVAVMARAWREALDADGVLPREEKLRNQRSFVLSAEREGMVRFHGAASPIEAAELKAYFSESTAPDAQPRFLSEEDRARATADLLPGEEIIRDPRTREQRQFDIVMGLLRAGVRSTGQGSTATVMAVIKLDDLENGTGVGWLDNVAEPVSASTVSEMVCDSGFRRLVLGPQGEVLELGRTERSFSRAQRLALAARDGGCVWPQCTAPPSWCHAHHVEEWSKGGKTDIDNGALLCSAHHHMLHASDFEMRMIDGRPHLLAPPWLDPAREWRLVGRLRLTWAPSSRAA